MAEQREHLVEMSKRPNVTIQVIPESQGVTSGIGRAFSVLAFNSNSALVYLEEIGDARYIRDPGRVRPYVLAYEHLRASAWDDNKSAEFIRNG